MPRKTIAKHDIKKNGASDGNRTHATSLEGWNSTIELHSHLYFVLKTKIFILVSATYISYHKEKDLSIPFLKIFLKNKKKLGLNIIG